MDPSSKDFLDHLRDYVPFLLATGQAQPKVSAIRVVEAVISALIVALVIGAGTYFLAIPRIEATIASQGQLTRLELDFLQRQLIEARRVWENGQEADRRERAVLDTRLRNIETIAPRAARPAAN